MKQNRLCFNCLGTDHSAYNVRKTKCSSSKVKLLKKEFTQPKLRYPFLIPSPPNFSVEIRINLEIKRAVINLNYFREN